MATAVGAAPFLRFTDAIQPCPAAGPCRAYVGVERRRVLFAPETDRILTPPVKDDGSIALIPAEDLPPLAPGSLGLRLELAFLDSAVPLFSQKRRKYIVLRREQLDVPRLVLRPTGSASNEARVAVRQVYPASQAYVSPPVRIPPGARLDFALGLQQDWRIARGAGAHFSLSIQTPSGWRPLFTDTFVYDPPLGGVKWAERRVDLAAYAGKSVSFCFASAPATLGPEPHTAFPLWANPVLHGRSEQSTGRPNVLFVSLDTCRSDHLGCYGYPIDTSPALDSFAANAILFETAVAPAPWTTPSHASLFTGLHPATHQAGVFSQGYYLRPHWETLAERLREAGYLTAAITEGIAVRAQMGFAQGFDRYSDGLSPEEHRTCTAPQTFEAAGDWLEDFGHLPFFLFVHTYEIHAPYVPPREWLGRYADLSFPDILNGIAENAFTPEERRHIVNSYDACIGYTDHHLGKLFERMRALGLFDDTLIVVFSDHGEEFWEHGGTGHTNVIYDETLRVPLIIKLPGATPAKARIATQVGLSDVYATVLEVLGLDVPDGLDSYSLLPLISPNTDPEPYGRRQVVSELRIMLEGTFLPEGAPVEWLMRSIREPEWKYIRSDRAWISETKGQSPGPAKLDEELYAIGREPAEKQNRLEEKAEEAQRLRTDLEAFAEDCEALRDRHTVEQETSALNPDDLESLRNLGYL